MLLYRGMDVGTAKPSPAERARVPHHLIDLAEPDVDGQPLTDADVGLGAARGAGYQKGPREGCRQGPGKSRGKGRASPSR